MNIVFFLMGIIVIFILLILTWLENNLFSWNQRGYVIKNDIMFWYNVLSMGVYGWFDSLRSIQSILALSRGTVEGDRIMKYQKKVNKLLARQKGYEELDKKDAYKKPGSLNGRR